ncbi:MAG: 2-hydroxyacid dehydrogenase [Puniceicoccales bacterium]|jgi:D-lactate dehydrogenase|nr:2-hydroxyacid dehydrogenase [Puniceicoccales bacterium]
MDVAFFDLNDWEISAVTDYLAKTDLKILCLDKEIPTAEKFEKIKSAEILSVFLSPIPKDLMNILPNLKAISLRTTGFDYVDLANANQRGIKIANVPSYGENTVAEYAFALLLDIARKIHMSYAQSTLGSFRRDNVTGVDLIDKTMGIIGTGRIGRNMVRMAHGFGMKVIAYDPYPNNDIIDQYKVQYVSMEEILTTADAISLHVPYSKESHHLINRDNVLKMKKGVLLVNTARGPLIETEALLLGLENEIFGGVALDTFEGEKYWCEPDTLVDNTLDSNELVKAVMNFNLQQFKNVILTPHNAYNSREAIERILYTALDNMIAFAKTGNCSNFVN